MRSNLKNVEVKGKIGIVAVAHVREPKQRVKNILYECIEQLRSRKFEVIFGGDIVCNQTRVRNAIDELKKEEVEAIIVVVTNWLEPPTIVHPLQVIREIPLIIWGFPETNTLLQEGVFLGSSSAWAVIKSALEQMNWKFWCVMGMPKWKEVIDKVESYLRTAIVRQKVGMSILGLIGYKSMGIYTATFDPLGLKGVFGIEIDTRADTYILVEEMKNIEESRVEIVQNHLKEQCWIDKKILSDNSLQNSIRMYFALKKMVEEGDWQGLSVKCQHELTSYLKCSACLPLAMMTDEGIMCSDEGDIHALLTMLIMHYFSPAKIFFGDIYPFEKDKFLMSHCGLIPHSCRKTGTHVRLNPQTPRISKDGKTTGGVVSTLQFDEGEKVTLARLEGRREGGYKMHVATGKVNPFSSVAYNFSTALVELESDPQSFIKNQLSNHYIMIWDDIKNELKIFCEYTGIKFID